MDKHAEPGIAEPGHALVMLPRGLGRLSRGGTEAGEKEEEGADRFANVHRWYCISGRDDAKTETAGKAILLRHSHLVTISPRLTTGFLLKIERDGIIRSKHHGQWAVPGRPYRHELQTNIASPAHDRV
jgi:hypothetical protein